MYCKKCGTRLSDNANFCVKCGTAVSQIKKSNTEEIIEKNETHTDHILENEQMNSVTVDQPEQVKVKEIEPTINQLHEDNQKIENNHRQKIRNSEMNFWSLFKPRLFVHFVNISTIILFLFPWVKLPVSAIFSSDTKSYSIPQIIELLITGGDLGIEFSTLTDSSCNNREFFQIIGIILMFIALFYFIVLIELGINEYHLLLGSKDAKDILKELKKVYLWVSALLLSCWIIIVALQISINNEFDYDFGEYIVAPTSIIYIIFAISLIMRLKYINFGIQEYDEFIENNRIYKSVKGYYILHFFQITFAVLCFTNWFEIPFISYFDDAYSKFSYFDLAGLYFTKKGTILRNAISEIRNTEGTGGFFLFLFIFAVMIIVFAVCLINLLIVEKELIFSKNNIYIYKKITNIYRGILYFCVATWLVTFATQLFLSHSLNIDFTNQIISNTTNVYILAFLLFLSIPFVKKARDEIEATGEYEWQMKG